MEGILEHHEIVQASAAITQWDTDPLGSLLVQKKNLKESELNSILSHSRNRDGSLAFMLIRFGLVSEQDIANVLSEITGFPLLQTHEYPDVHFLQANISTRFLKSIRAVPIFESATTLIVAMVDPRDV
ncbi:GspE/PulE/PilB domain-containing protein, partial [Kaarinaea lacus]